jgi:hypothetical protein
VVFQAAAASFRDITRSLPPLLYNCSKAFVFDKNLESPHHTIAFHQQITLIHHKETALQPITTIQRSLLARISSISAKNLQHSQNRHGYYLDSHYHSCIAVAQPTS